MLCCFYAYFCGLCSSLYLLFSQAGLVEAEGLNLTIETFKQKDENKLDIDGGLLKKRSFRAIRSPVRPPQVGFFNRKLSTKQKPFILSRSSLQSSQSSDIIDPDYADIEAVSETDSAERVITPPDIVISQQ